MIATTATGSVAVSIEPNRRDIIQSQAGYLNKYMDSVAVRNTITTETKKIHLTPSDDIYSQTRYI